jgi:hypothetical protein
MIRHACQTCWQKEPVRVVYSAVIAVLLAVGVVLEGGWPGWSIVWQAGVAALLGEARRYQTGRRPKP